MKFQVADTPDAIAILIEQVESELMDAAIPFAAVHAAVLCIEELVVNILKHGKIEGKEPNIEVEVQLEDGRMVIDISDDTTPFDPTAAGPPQHIDAPLEDRPIGGLGIHLVQTLTNELSYKRVGQRNHLRLVKRFDKN
jgi:anti-sigma regulatory factor (Ser/Thr protein kinase)